MSKEKLTEGQKLRNAYKKAVETRERFLMKDQTPWTSDKEEKAQDHKLLEMSKLLEDYLEHKFDVITDSDWFHELVQEKVDIRVHEIMNEEKK